MGRPLRENFLSREAYPVHGEMGGVIITEQWQIRPYRTESFTSALTLRTMLDPNHHRGQDDQGAKQCIGDGNR